MISMLDGDMTYEEFIEEIKKELEQNIGER